MALQFCVKCGKKEMTWAIDEDISPYTYWHCSHCEEIVAWEDEAKCCDCQNCNSEKSLIFVWTKENAFGYCLNCKIRKPYLGEKPEWIEQN